MKEYFKKKRISNSSITWFQRSPKYFKMMLDGLIEEPSRPWLEYGQQAHMYILELNEFNKEYTFMEYSIPKSQQQKTFCEKFAYLKKGKKEEKLLKAYKEAYISKEKNEKVLEKAKKLEKDFKNYINYIKIKHVYTKVLQSSVLDKLNKTKTSVLKHKRAQELLINEENSTFGNTEKLFIQNEFAIYWEWIKPEYVKVPCKSMIDRIIIDHENKIVKLIDLKTTSHIGEFPEKFKEYKYNRQLAFYWMAIYWYFKHELDKDINEYEKETYIVAVATTDPIETKVYKIMQNTLSEGMTEIEYEMHKLNWHWVNDKWDYSMLYYEGEGIELI